MGPISLFDKSFLQTLSTDESVWFDNFFYPVVCPLFFIETLADLEKPPREGKTAEQEVGFIAAKTPQMSGAPCHFHRSLSIQSLLGNPVPMNGQIPVAGMRRVQRAGKPGAVVDVTPEADAFMRWQEGRFYDVERRHARTWRSHLARIDLGNVEAAVKATGITGKTCKTLEEAKRIADGFVLRATQSPGRFDTTLEALDIPDELRRPIKDRWKSLKRPSLRSFAPYAAHVLNVEFFFRVALGANLVASTRASHSVDMAYLFYLPFCQIFVSTDRLHRNCAPLFLRSDQEFVWGQDLKSDLTALNAHYTGLDEAVKAQGIYKFANRLPDSSQGVIRALFARYTPRLLRPQPQAVNLSPEAMAKIVAEAKGWEKSSIPLGAPEVADEELESLLINRSVHRRRGSWFQIGPEVPDDR